MRTLNSQNKEERRGHREEKNTIRKQIQGLKKQQQQSVIPEKDYPETEGKFLILNAEITITKSI